MEEEAREESRRQNSRRNQGPNDVVDVGGCFVRTRDKVQVLPSEAAHPEVQQHWNHLCPVTSDKHTYAPAMSAPSPT